MGAKRGAKGKALLLAVAAGLTLSVAAVWLMFGSLMARAEAGASEFGASEAAVASQTIAVFERRFRDDPYRYPDGNRLVDLYMLRFHRDADPADLARAEEIARLVLPAAPDRATAEARLALVLIARHGFQEAYEHARSAVEADPGKTAALAVLFDAAVALGRYSEAENALSEMRPGTFARRLREARWLSAHGELEEAGRLLRRACEKLGSSPVPAQVVAWCITQVAKIEHQRRGPGAARTWLHHALDVDPAHRGAIEGLAKLAYAEGKWAEARRLYLRIRSDAHADLYLRLAEVHRMLGDDDLAAQHEARFLQIAGDPDVEALYARQLAVYLAASEGSSRAESQARALMLARRDVTLRPSTVSYEVLAWVRLTRGEPTEALAVLDEAPGWGEPGPATLYLRARALEALGRAREARPLYAGALEDPTLLPPHLLRDLSAPGERP